MGNSAPLNPDHKRVAMRKEREISRRLLIDAINPELGSTKAEILEASGLHHSTFTRIISSLREENLVHIGARRPRIDELTGERKAGTQIIVYARGAGEDAKPVKRIPKKKVAAKWQAKRRIVQRAKTLAREGKSNMFDQLRYAA